jgi:predicted metalloprotease
MQWQGRRQSSNVEDRRGVRTGGIAVGGGAIAVIITLIALFLGGDPGSILSQGGSLLPTATTAVTSTPAQDEMARFVGVVLADTEDFWTQQFRDMGYAYDPPKLVLFTDYVNTGSGTASAATGPFYSPADQKVYIDLSFYDELRTRFGAPGDFAQAYVIAHEVGHAVQDQLGIMNQVDVAQQRAGGETANQLSVRLELQADFFAGLWGHYETALGVVQPGDIEEALTAANAIGDDRLQKQSQGYVVPDSFTHGTSAQRVKWFKLGYDSGDFNQGDTFSVPYDQL